MGKRIDCTELKEKTMRKITERFVSWCAEDTPAARFERSIAQGVIGAAVGMLSGVAASNPVVGAVVAPCVMAIIAPIQAQIGKAAGSDGAE